MLDERVRRVLQRLEAEDAAERERALPAVEPVATFPVRVDDGMIKVKLV